MENSLARNRATYEWDQIGLRNKRENHAETLGPAVQVLGLRLEQVQPGLASDAVVPGCAGAQPEGHQCSPIVQSLPQSR